MIRQPFKAPSTLLGRSPSHDNRSREEINQIIHSEMQARGYVEESEHRMKVLVPRQEMTGADRQWARQYDPGDVVRYTKGSEVLGIEAGAYARVRVDQEQNLATMERINREHQTYDPRHLQGVTLYREAERTFAEEDRAQLTAPYRQQQLANRDLGTIEEIGESGRVNIHLDSGRSVELNHKSHPISTTAMRSPATTARGRALTVC